MDWATIERIRDVAIKLRPLSTAGVILTAGLLTVAGLSTATANEDPEPAAFAATAIEGPDISLDNTMAHIAKFQEIADANGGTRGTGQPGYRASIEWVKSELERAGYRTELQSFQGGRGNGESWNLIAEWPEGDPDQVVMIGAHLDSARTTAGSNDNASGSAGILETALEFARSGIKPVNRLRVAFWGDEEQGLVGSNYYGAQLSADEVSKFLVYLNFDMIGSTNAGYFVYNDNPKGNFARDDLTAYYDSIDLPWEYIDVQGRSDHAALRRYGVPTSGLFSGASGPGPIGTKTAAQAEKWGGTPGPFDPCYHLPCDNSSNISRESVDRHIDAIGYVTFKYLGEVVPAPPRNRLRNPGFEYGRASWSPSRGVISKSDPPPARTGSGRARLGGQGKRGTTTITQDVMIPADVEDATLSYWLRIGTTDKRSINQDRFTVQVVNGKWTRTLERLSNTDAAPRWVRRTADLSRYAGRSVKLRFTAIEDAQRQTSFVLDDLALHY